METTSPRRWIWSAADEIGRGRAVELEGGVFASERGPGAEEASESTLGNLFEIMTDFDSEFEVVAAAGRLVGPGDNSAVAVDVL